jgi:hypothetical protein
VGHQGILGQVFEDDLSQEHPAFLAPSEASARLALEPELNFFFRRVLEPALALKYFFMSVFSTKQGTARSGTALGAAAFLGAALSAA